MYFIRVWELTTFETRFFSLLPLFDIDLNYKKMTIYYYMPVNLHCCVT